MERLESRLPLYGVGIDLQSGTIYVEGNNLPNYIEGYESGQFAIINLDQSFTEIDRNQLLFNKTKYQQLNPDVTAAIQAGSIPSGIHHWVHWGHAENRQGHDFNDPLYREVYTDVAAHYGPGQSSVHFASAGYQEGRHLPILFNSTYYLLANPDVASAVQAGWMPSAYYHWFHHGRHEDRPANDPSLPEVSNFVVYAYAGPDTIHKHFHQFGMTATLDGGSGEDYIHGGAGLINANRIDRYFGGPDNDILDGVASALGSYFDGGLGIDRTLALMGATLSPKDNPKDINALVGNRNDQPVVLVDRVLYLWGTEAADSFDLITFYNDTYLDTLHVNINYGGAHSALVFDAHAIDYIVAWTNGGNDSVYNYTYIASAIYGGAGADLLEGGLQGDIIRGGLGNDSIRGWWSRYDAYAAWSIFAPDDLGGQEGADIYLVAADSSDRPDIFRTDHLDSFYYY